MTISQFNIEEVRWQNDLAVFRSMNAHVPWAERFGAGKLKVLRFDLDTQAGTWLMLWPTGYDPMGHHGYGGNAELWIFEGTLDVEGETLGPGTYLSVPNGEKHGPLTPGPEGCIFAVSVDGPLFEQEFEQALMEMGTVSRRRAQVGTATGD